MKYQSPSTYHSKVIAKVKVSDRMTEGQNDRQDKNNMPPDLRSRGHKNDWLIVYCLSSHSRIFHSYGDVTITGERLQILTYTRRLRPLSSEGPLACHTCCDTGHPFLRSSPRTRDIHTCCRAFGSGTVTTCVNDLGLSRPGFEHPTFRMRGERSTDWATAAVCIKTKSDQSHNYLKNENRTNTDL